eukprot:Lithocolla_globosa_v1_NODE_10997_length_545_cov_35.987755.p1 type:complete len:137 gc:universal NODE_10997_length_545_cov_35.987755:67-477(+)
MSDNEEAVHQDTGSLPANKQMGLPAERIIWKGATWPRGLCSPLCCSERKFTISNRRIDYTHGCCGGYQDTLDIRRVKDLRFERTLWQMCCCRGTLVVFSGDETTPKMRITTFGMQEVYKNLREAWLQAKTTVAVDL